MHFISTTSKAGHLTDIRVPWVLYVQSPSSLDIDHSHLSLLFPVLCSGDVDYDELTNVPVVFVPGVTVQGVTLTTLRDVPVEGEETLRASLTVGFNNVDPTRVVIVVQDATVTITEEVGKYIIL